MAKLIEQFREKNHYDNKRYVLETRIWLVEDRRFPHGVKYSLIFIDFKSYVLQHFGVKV